MFQAHNYHVCLISVVLTKELHMFAFSELKVNNVICSSSLTGPSLQEKLSTLHLLIQCEY